jgi:hypothetical protein
MKSNWNCRAGYRRTILSRIAPIALISALPLAGCSDLLSVEDPSMAKPETLTGKDGLPALHAGAVGDFALAFSGSSGVEGYVNLVGLFTDEMHHTETFPDRLNIDMRKIETQEGTQQTNYRNMHRARNSAEEAIEAFAEFGDMSVAADANSYAEVLNLAGFSYVMFGENFCSGVPFSKVAKDGKLEYGPALTTAQTFGLAVENFDKALDVVADTLPMSYLARIGKARALLNQGEFDEAAALVKDVPTKFVYQIQHSENSGRQQNGIWNFQTNARRWGVSDMEGGNGLPFRSANDPRVAWKLRKDAADKVVNGFDNSSPLYDQLKYPARTTSVTLANGIEARLIEAEAALYNNDVGTWLAMHNAARATVAGLGTLADPGAADRLRVHFQERGFWLFLTAHRLGDMRRMVSVWNQDADDVYPGGDHFKGSPYGTDLSFPIPVDEKNNPEYMRTFNADLKGCLSAGA